MKKKFVKSILYICVPLFFTIFSLSLFADEKVLNQDDANVYAEYRIKYAKDIRDWEQPTIDYGVYYEEMQPLPDIAPSPSHNPFTKEKSLLGKKLFNEPNLSKSGQISCANCHNKELAFGDGIKTSFGHNRQRGTRNAPNIMMSGFFEKLFWDGRADSLEKQALMPIVNPIEMAHELDNMQKFVSNTTFYHPLFILAFGDEEHKKGIYHWYLNITKDSEVLNAKDTYKSFIAKLITLDMRDESMDFLQNKLSLEYMNYAKKLITKQNIAKAIASYERSLVPKNTKFNRFLNGDYSALSDKEIYGLHIFRTKGRCMNCHYGVALSDGKFHNLGLSFYGRKLQDLGYYEVTKNKEDMGAFKTPSLIAISKSAPYMHNGIFPDLLGVINMYNAGFPTQNDITHKTELIKPLKLNNEEIDALFAFLLTL